MTKTRLTQASDVLAEEVDGQLLLLKTGSSDVLHLDAVASNVWRLLVTSPTREELAAVLAATYDVPVARVATDLVPALEVLRSRGLLHEGQ